MPNSIRNIVILSVVLSIFIFPPQARAALICRDNDQHRICILSIERSAKNYWEYRAAVQIDEQVRPVEIYDCKKSIRIDKNGNEISFESDGVLEFICGLFKK